MLPYIKKFLIRVLIGATIFFISSAPPLSLSHAVIYLAATAVKYIALPLYVVYAIIDLFRGIYKLRQPEKDLQNLKKNNSVRDQIKSFVLEALILGAGLIFLLSIRPLLLDVGVFLYLPVTWSIVLLPFYFIYLFTSLIRNLYRHYQQKNNPDYVLRENIDTSEDLPSEGASKVPEPVLVFSFISGAVIFLFVMVLLLLILMGMHM